MDLYLPLLFPIFPSFEKVAMKYSIAQLLLTDAAMSSHLEASNTKIDYWGTGNPLKEVEYVEMYTEYLSLNFLNNWTFL